MKTFFSFFLNLIIGPILIVLIHCDQNPQAQTERYISVFFKPLNTIDLDSSDTYELYQLYVNEIKYTGETRADSTGKVYAVSDTIWEYRIIDSIFYPYFSKSIQIVNGKHLAILHCIGGKMGELLRTRKAELKNLIENGPSNSSLAFISELKEYDEFIYDGKLHLRYYNYPPGNISDHGEFKIFKKPRNNDTITYLLTNSNYIQSTSSSSYYK